MRKNSIAEILDHIITNGGATVALAGGDQYLMTPSDGDVYMVGGALTVLGESVPELFVPLDDLNESAVAFALDYVLNLADVNNFTAAGFWIENGMVAVDATDAVEGCELATKIGNARGERAMYRLMTGETITLNAGAVSEDA